MPIKEVKPGKFRLDYGLVNGARKVLLFNGTKADAEREFETKRLLMRSARFVDPATAPRIDDAVEVWMDRQRRRLKEDIDGSIIGEMQLSDIERTVARHFCDLIWRGKRLGSRRTTDLTVEVFEDDLLPLLKGRKNNRTGKTVSLTTAKAGLINIRRFLRYCVKMKWLERDPSEHVKISVKHEKRARNLRRISPMEMQAIIAAAPQHYRKQIMFAAYTGLRAGEQVALRWENVDLENGVVSVVEARKAKTRRIGDTKTIAGQRRVTLEPSVLAMLREWKLRQPLEQRGRGLVFPTRTGNIAEHANWAKRGLHKACKAAQVERCNWHDLRHFYASVLIFKTDLNEAVITELMGHRNISFTAEFYGRWFQDSRMEKEIAEKLGNAFGTGETL